MSELTGKTIIVTGTASGIGAATAQALQHVGARVIGLDRTRTCARVDEFHSCDLSDPGKIESITSCIGGPIHGLANVAGVPGSQPAELIAKVNVLAVRRLTELLLPRIEPGGAVVNVASAAGAYWRNRLEDIKCFLATSGWTEGLQEILRLNLTPAALYDYSKELVIVYSAYASGIERHRGIRVNSVSPGAVQTPILRDFYQTMDNALLEQIKRQAGGRDAYPAEIADPILFLLSESSRWVNGTDLLVDGGGEVALTLGPLAIPPKS